MRTDDTTQDSEETTTAFTSKTREQSFSLKIHESKSKRTWLEGYIEAVSFRRIATVEQLEYIHTHTHTQSALLYPSYGYASRHNNVVTTMIIIVHGLGLGGLRGREESSSGPIVAFSTLCRH